MDIVRTFSQEEMNAYAEQWKKYGVLNKRLVNTVIYDATISLCESKRDKEIIEKVAKMQNSILEKFFNDRNNKSIDKL